MGAVGILKFEVNRDTLSAITPHSDSAVHQRVRNEWPWTTIAIGPRNLRSGSLDAGFCNEGGEPDSDLATIEVSRFKTHVVVAPGFVAAPDSLDWRPKVASNSRAKATPIASGAMRILF